MKRLSEQPSLLTVDTHVFEGPAQPSPTISVSQADAVDAGALEVSSLPLPQFPNRASLSRPPSRGRPMTSPSIGNPAPRPYTPTDTPTKPNLATSTPSLPLDLNLNINAFNHPSSSLNFPIRGETTPTAETIDIYNDHNDDITPELNNPFRPSATWSTVPTTDEWVDETVSSLALSRSASQVQGRGQGQSQVQRNQGQSQQNWTVLQESPGIVNRGRDVMGSAGMLTPGAASSLVQLPEVEAADGEREGTVDTEASSSPVLSRPGTAGTLGSGIAHGRVGLAQQSQSKGVVSLRSEGSRSEYAAFI